MMHYKKVLGALTILGVLAMGGTAFAQTASTTTTGTAVTPGAPNTGAGGNAAENYILLGGSALIVAAGATYLGRRKTA